MTTTHELRIEGMSCQHCVKTVDAALRRVPGVTAVQVEIGRAKVTAETATREALIAALAEADYPAS